MLELVYDFTKDISGGYKATCKTQPKYTVERSNIDDLVETIVLNVAKDFGDNITFEEIFVIEDKNDEYRLKLIFKNENILH